MKKSRLLQNPKEMLSRSFNPTKCKTSLRLATSRFKLLKNKKEVQVKQMRREIAQLLESGEDQKARMRVEHVIREEKMIAAYDLLDIYCELAIARLPVIESQKICPPDLKEAIASVIFASLRCGDVPELLDVKKQFSAKYGKDFTTAAIEIRPQSGVGRMLVEKLSAAAPDVQVKNKILSAIAEEHNVKWEHEPLEEKNSIPSNDLPNGGNTFGGSRPYGEQTYSEPANSQMLPSTSKVNSVPSVLQHGPRITVEEEKVTSSQPSIVNTTYQPETRPQSQGDNRTHVFQGDGNSIPSHKPRWSMEFKDATSAAQAAAESAEMASMAAKAAAELSMRDRITGQDSTESDPYVAKDERPETHQNQKPSHEQFPKEHVKESSSAHIGSHNEQIDRINHYNHETATRSEDNHHGGAEYRQPAPVLKSGSSSVDEPQNSSVPTVDRFSENNSLGKIPRSETSMKSQSFNHVAEPSNDWAEQAQNHPADTTERQHSVPSRSYSGLSDDVNVFANSEDPVDVKDAGDNPFADNTEREAAHQMSSNEDAPVVYDNFDSDTDDHGFDLGPKYDRHYSGFNFPSSSQKSPEHPSVKTDSWSPRSNLANPVDPVFVTRENSPPAFSDNSTSRVDADVDTFAPVTFDDSDGSESDIEGNLISGRRFTEDPRGGLHNIEEREKSSTLQFGSPLRQSGIQRKQLSISSDDELKLDEREQSSALQLGSTLRQTGIHRKQLSISSDDEVKHEEVDCSLTKSKKFDTGSHRSNLKKLSAAQPAFGLTEAPELNIIDNESSSDDDGNTRLARAKKGDVRSPTRLSLHKKSAAQSGLGLKESQELNNSGDESNSDNEEIISFGRLTGGLRNKGRTGLPSLKNRLNDSSSIKKETEKTTAKATTTSTVTQTAQRPVRTTMLYNKKTTPDLPSESDSDSSRDEEILMKPSVQKPEIRNRKEVGAKPSLGSSNLILHSDSSDLDEDSSKESLTGKNKLQTGISRRTRASPAASSGTNSYPKMHSRSEDIDKDIVSKPSYTSATRKESEKQNSGKLENYDQSTSSKVASKPAKSIFWGPPEKSKPANTTPLQEPRPSVRTEMDSPPITVGEKSRISSSSSAQHKGHHFNRNSGKLVSSEHPDSSKMGSKPIASSSLGTSAKPKEASTTTQKPKISQNSSKVEEPLKPPQKPEAAISSGDSKSETSNQNSSNKNESPKRASHVHPKLPDYDTLFQSLRNNRS